MAHTLHARPDAALFQTDVDECPHVGSSPGVVSGALSTMFGLRALGPAPRIMDVPTTTSMLLLRYGQTMFPRKLIHVWWFTASLGLVTACADKGNHPDIVFDSDDFFGSPWPAWDSGPQTIKTVLNRSEG